MKSILKSLVILSVIVPYCYSMENINKYETSEIKYETNKNQLKMQLIDRLKEV